MSYRWDRCPRNKISSFVEQHSRSQQRKMIFALAMVSVVLTVLISSVAAHLFDLKVPWEQETPVMTCVDVDRLYGDFKDGTLDPEIDWAIKRHINSCCRCWAKYKPHCRSYENAFQK